MRAPVLLVAILGTSFFFIQNSFGGASDDNTIRLNIHLGANTSITSENLRQTVQSAEDCLNQAFRLAGSRDFHLSLSIQGSTNLTSEEEAKLPAHFMAPLLDDGGRPLPGFVNGARTNQFDVFLSKSVSRSNVKSLYSASIPLKERLLAIKTAQARKNCDDIFDTELDPVQRALNGPCQDSQELRALRDTIGAKYTLACDISDKLEDEAIDRPMPNASAIFVHPEATASDLGKTLAHELMHAFGGLQDRYKGSAASRQRWSTNLMGAGESAQVGQIGLVCSLAPDQIKALLAYRKTGKMEKWP